MMVVMMVVVEVVVVVFMVLLMLLRVRMQISHMCRRFLVSH